MRRPHLARKTVVLSVILCCLGCATADADQHQRPHHARQAVINPLPVAIRRAEAYWHAVPCGGKPITFIVSATPPAGVKPSPDEAAIGYLTLEGYADVASCSIWLTSSEFGSWRLDDDLGWLPYCWTVTHEIGHLLSHVHQYTDPNNPMYVGTKPWTAGWCRDTAYGRP